MFLGPSPVSPPKTISRALRSRAPATLGDPASACSTPSRECRSLQQSPAHRPPLAASRMLTWAPLSLRPTTATKTRDIDSSVGPRPSRFRRCQDARGSWCSFACRCPDPDVTIGCIRYASNPLRPPTSEIEAASSRPSPSTLSVGYATSPSGKPAGPLCFNDGRTLATPHPLARSARRRQFRSSSGKTGVSPRLPHNQEAAWGWTPPRAAKTGLSTRPRRRRTSGSRGGAPEGTPPCIGWVVSCEAGSRTSRRRPVPIPCHHDLGGPTCSRFVPD